MISLSTARDLIDFSGSAEGGPARISDAQAAAQLEGAVAIHNILKEHSVAYLADEVGMGKTYVALGAFALFRHFDPNFRLLVIAPKENIQLKWVKEHRNFVRNNIRIADQRIKAIHQAPARPSVLCGNLMSLVSETAIDPDRDFFARLSSFSFGLTDDTTTWGDKLDRLLATVPWLNPDWFDLGRNSIANKNSFKENFARAACCALPEFDLVIVDEGHNLKGGLHSHTWRNRLLALTMGREPDGIKTPRHFAHFGPRAKRVLFLSATPLEDDYRHVWNQLAVFGLEDAVKGLEDPALSSEDKKLILAQILIRRVNQLNVGGSNFTKNQYRREWRGGGVSNHDDHLDTPDERQQLVVALVQKKVSELLNSERFNNSFQIGMLASFESFTETAKVKRADETNFDDADQTDDELEREGIDIHSVNALAKSYRKKFDGQELPHPKMDAIVNTLGSSFESGEKALVFVRRVASVKELQRKLELQYDGWLFSRLSALLQPTLRTGLEEMKARYQVERTAGRTAGSASDGTSDLSLDTEEDPLHRQPETRGGNETFFAWFFRGEGPKGVISGAELAFRLNTPRYALSSFFQDNWVSAVLGVPPGQVFDALAAATGMAAEQLRAELEIRAGRVVPLRSRNTHRELFLAFQNAALSILAVSEHSSKPHAAIMKHQLFDLSATGSRSIQLGTWLETSTFFTALRQRPELRAALWPEEPRPEFVAAFRRAELRRELIASLCRLGAPLLDLWVTYVNRLGRLETKAERTELDSATFAADFLDLLETQRASSTYSAWRELSEAAAHFDLIVDTNAPSLWERSLAEVKTELGQLLGEQQPVGGMSGGVNRTLVRQFRMPGYPQVLVSTDILQEGEDLHLFCSRVYHYGISWMPSSTEQRIGRIDRVRSETERRLSSAGWVTGNSKLQVFYPHLRETVEIFQVNRVFKRLNDFMVLMHEGFGSADDARDRKIDVEFEATQPIRSVAQLDKPLESSFPVTRSMTSGPRASLAVLRSHERQVLERFRKIEQLAKQMPITWHPRESINSLIGTWKGETRSHPFTLLLHSIGGRLNIRCISPIGQVAPSSRYQQISDESRNLMVRIAAVYDSRFEKYDLTAEGDVLLGAMSSDLPRVRWLVETVVAAADVLEQVLLQIDVPPEEFHDDLELEAGFER